MDSENKKYDVKRDRRSQQISGKRGKRRSERKRIEDENMKKMRAKEQEGRERERE